MLIIVLDVRVLMYGYLFYTTKGDSSVFLNLHSYQLNFSAVGFNCSKSK